MTRVQLILKYPEIYQEAKSACENSDCDMSIENPHKEKSEQWQVWNVGWNSAKF